MQPTIVAHRGLHVRWPENSLAAFRAAWESGFTWCECDVQLSSDGELVVLHDDTLERLTSATGRADQLTWRELSALRLRDANGMLTEQRIPSLDELLYLLPAGKYLWVETKPALGTRIETLAKKLAAKGCGIHSFNLDDVLIARKFTTQAAFLSETTEQLPDSVKRIHFNHECLSEQLIGMLRARGIRIGAWTVNDRYKMVHFGTLGVEIMMTDLELRSSEMNSNQPSTK